MKVSGGYSSDVLTKMRANKQASGGGQAEALNDRRRAQAQQRAQQHRALQQSHQAERPQVVDSAKGNHVNTHA